MTAMTFSPGVHRIGKFHVESVRRQVERDGFVAFLLPSDGIIDRQSFFESVKCLLPLDPPLLGSQNWDALSDSLWEGLYLLSAKRIAILWPNTEAMEAHSPTEFQMALGVFVQVSRALADVQATVGDPKQLAIIAE